MKIWILTCDPNWGTRFPKENLLNLYFSYKVDKNNARKTLKYLCEEGDLVAKKIMKICENRNKVYPFTVSLSFSSTRVHSVTGYGNTPLEKNWRKHEFNRSMSDEDHLLGGPRKILTLRQYAKANGYDPKTGERIKSSKR